MKSLIKFGVLIFSACLVCWPAHRTNSCGFTISDAEYRFWVFNPSLKGIDGTYPFFYTSELYNEKFTYYNEYTLEGYTSVEANTQELYYDENNKQWLTYAKTLSDTLAIEEVLYNTNSDEYFTLKDKLLESNAFLRWAKGNEAVLNYIDFAKKAEGNINVGAADWNSCFDCPTLSQGKLKVKEGEYYDYNNEYPNVRREVIDEATVLFEKETDPFLKRRYAFQGVRLAYYGRDSASLTHSFQKGLANGPKDWLYYDALMYEASGSHGAQLSFKLAQVFDKCPNKRFRCVQLYDPTHYAEAVMLANNNHEQAMVEVMQAIHNPQPCLNQLKNLSWLEPKNDFLPFLWIREINKLEDWLLGPLYSGFGSTRAYNGYYYEEDMHKLVMAQLLNDKAYAKLCLANLDLLLQRPEMDKHFYALCAGYIAYMVGDLAKSSEYYALVDPNQLSSKAKTQFALCKYMHSLSANPKVSNTHRSSFLNLIAQLEEEEKANPDMKFIKEQLIAFSAKEFMARGARAEGLMLFGKSNKGYQSHDYIGVANAYTQLYEIGNSANVKEVIAILDKKEKSAFEAYLASAIYSEYSYEYKDWNRDKVMDLLTMHLVKEDKLGEAYQWTLRINKNYWSAEPYNLFAKDDPFVVSPWNGHAALNQSRKTYTKPEFLKKLLELKVRAAKASGNEKASLLYLIGNAYFSMSYHGKYWIAQHYYWSSMMEAKNKQDEFMYPNRAKYYYKEALAHATDKNLGALIGNALLGLNTGLDDYMLSEDKVLKWMEDRKLNTDVFIQMKGNCDLFYEILNSNAYFVPLRDNYVKK